MAFTYRQIMASAAAEYGVTVDDILGRSTQADILTARYAALAACRAAHPHVSETRLSSWFEKDPSWAAYALRRLAGRTPTEARTARAA
ncbi:hypothetical protein [Methylobacterium aquaticum]|jgi:chromosomal replication initiation ATPase DnaA|uniref:Uncharacterized protein n=1 Tax=Methylobacterium aquaticum TaxID=270351 RepID=A0A0J6SKV1_9HYPH|nr:hypothetical protein [Methylobacterium aquaticum]KMO34294.1 hypothetical protein VP06_14570 [Methylobacterium aquaticum]